MRTCGHPNCTEIAILRVVDPRLAGGDTPACPLHAASLARLDGEADGQIWPLVLDSSVAGITQRGDAVQKLEDMLTEARAGRLTAFLYVTCHADAIESMLWGSVGDIELPKFALGIRMLGYELDELVHRELIAAAPANGG